MLWAERLSGGSDWEEKRDNHRSIKHTSGQPRPEEPIVFMVFSLVDHYYSPPLDWLWGISRLFCHSIFSRLVLRNKSIGVCLIVNALWFNAGSWSAFNCIFFSLTSFASILSNQWMITMSDKGISYCIIRRDYAWPNRRMGHEGSPDETAERNRTENKRKQSYEWRRISRCLLW